MKTEGTNLLLLKISDFWSSPWPLRWAPEGREVSHWVVVIDRFHCMRYMYIFPKWITEIDYCKILAAVVNQRKLRVYCITTSWQETRSLLLTLCGENPLVNGGFPWKGVNNDKLWSFPCCYPERAVEKHLSCQLRATYMRQWTGSALAQVMACAIR